MLQQMKSGKGFIAALDQSGGSTPKALALYGVTESAYSNEAEMFDRMHEMRSRLIKSPVFNGDRVIGAILFEMTMERTIDGLGSAEYLWTNNAISVEDWRLDQTRTHFMHAIKHLCFI